MNTAHAAGAAMNQSNQGAGMSEREQRIRIAVVDDHEMFRAGVIATLQRDIRWDFI